MLSKIPIIFLHFNRQPLFWETTKTKRLCSRVRTLQNRRFVTSDLLKQSGSEPSQPGKGCPSDLHKGCRRERDCELTNAVITAIIAMHRSVGEKRTCSSR